MSIAKLERAPLTVPNLDSQEFAAPITRTQLLDLVGPRDQVKLHPKGCKCGYHHPRSPWIIPQAPNGRGLGLVRPKLVLVDVENWQGGPMVSPLAVAREFRFTREVLGLNRHDYVIFGMSHFTSDRCVFSLPVHQGAVVLRSGANGADEALIDAADLRRLSRHYGTLVVVSNDHAFKDLAVRAKGFGMNTWNVSSDLSEIAPETRAAFDGWTHLKITKLREATKAPNPAVASRRGPRRSRRTA